MDSMDRVNGLVGGGELWPGSARGLGKSNIQAINMGLKGGALDRCPQLENVIYYL